MSTFDRVLVFRISAVMGSMGQSPGNELRASERWPARSAILGLIGAALGIDRAARTDQEALETGYRAAIARPAGSPGRLLIDFHTALAVPARASKNPATRAQALQDAREHQVNPVLTFREYYEDCRFDVAVVAAENARWSLDEIARALRAPRYVMYLGRKSCPLTAPLNPTVLTDCATLDAFGRYARHSLDAQPSKATDALIADRAHLVRGSASTKTSALSIMADLGMMGDRGEGRRTIRQRDRVHDRQAWLFVYRDVEIYDKVEVADA